MRILTSFLFVLLLNFDTTYAACGDGTCDSTICMERATLGDCLCTEQSQCDEDLEETCEIIGVDLGQCFEGESLVLCDASCPLCVEQSDPEQTFYVCYCDGIERTCPSGSCTVEALSSADGQGLCLPPRSSGTNSDSGGCFSDRSTCIEEQKGKILVKDVMVGDKVLTRSGRFQTVYTLDHVDTRKKTEFLQISYQKQSNHHNHHDNNDSEDNHTDDALLWAGGRGVLELTPSHMVFVHGRADPVAASQIMVGDVIEAKKEIINPSPAPHHHDKNNFVSVLGVVQKISKVSRKGLWNPITTDGTIVVDGVITSTYSAITFGTDQDDPHGGIEMGPSYISIGGIKLVSQHYFLHTLMGPFRYLCMITMGLSSTSLIGNEYYYNGFNVYSYIGNKLLGFTRERNEIIQGLILITVFLSCILFSLFVFGLPGVVAIFTGACVMRGVKRKKGAN